MNVAKLGKMWSSYRRRKKMAAREARYLRYWGHAMSFEQFVFYDEFTKIEDWEEMMRPLLAKRET